MKLESQLFVLPFKPCVPSSKHYINCIKSSFFDGRVVQGLIFRAEMVLIKRLKRVRVRGTGTNSYLRAVVMTTIKMLNRISKGAPRVDRCTAASCKWHNYISDEQISSLDYGVCVESNLSRS